MQSDSSRLQNPRTHTMDSSQFRSQETLTSTVQSSSTPPQISAAINSITAFLRRRPPHNHIRHFFSISFPALLLKIFAFDSPSPSSSAWVQLPDPDTARLLFDFLSPDGILFSTIANVDSQSLVRYAFPVERLPEWMRYVLTHADEKCRTVLADLCPLFKSRFRGEDTLFEVNVFEYYMFWFAYYPVCIGTGNGKGNEGDGVKTQVVRGGKSRRFRLENWALSLPRLSGGRQQVGEKAQCGLYLKLLYSYLKAFVPLNHDNLCHPYRSSLLHHTLSYDVSLVLCAEFLVNTLVQFWMVDNDFSPFPLSLRQSFGLNLPLRTALGEAPSSVGLGEVLKLLVKYVNCGLRDTDGNLVVYGANVRQKVRGSDDAGLWNSTMQRPLYRFILRTFLFCPMGTTMGNAIEVFHLWKSYLEPWKSSAADFVAFELPMRKETGEQQADNNLGKCVSDLQSTYSPGWQGYILHNYLFYSSLFVHFLGFAHKFLHTNIETVLQMVLELLNILASSTELVDLLKKVEGAYHSKSSGPSSASFNCYYNFIPSIREQLQDWEDGLCETDADGSFLYDNWNRDLRLFSEDEDGAHQLLELLIQRSEFEIRSISGENSQNLQKLSSLSSQMNAIFGVSKRMSSSPPLNKGASAHQQEHGEIFSPNHHPCFGRRTRADAKYKGDWMRRPVSSGEVTWLARFLVRLSDILNVFLGLNKDGHSDVCAKRTYIEVPPGEVNGVHSLKDAIWMLVAFIGSSILMLTHILLKFARDRGWRINLRVLASKKVVTAVVILVVASALKKSFGMPFGSSVRSHCKFAVFEW